NALSICLLADVSYIFMRESRHAEHRVGHGNRKADCDTHGNGERELPRHREYRGSPCHSEQDESDSSADDPHAELSPSPSERTPCFVVHHGVTLAHLNHLPARRPRLLRAVHRASRPCFRPRISRGRTLSSSLDVTCFERYCS